jgi:ornithine decarboxylase
MGVSFHVGSQCMRPTAYQAAMAQAQRAIVRAGVLVDIVDVGGGFPSVYPAWSRPTWPTTSTRSSAASPT